MIIDISQLGKPQTVHFARQGVVILQSCRHSLMQGIAVEGGVGVLTGSTGAVACLCVLSSVLPDWTVSGSRHHLTIRVLRVAVSFAGLPLPIQVVVVTHSAVVTDGIDKISASVFDILRSAWASLTCIPWLVAVVLTVSTFFVLRG